MCQYYLTIFLFLVEITNIDIAHRDFLEVQHLQMSLNNKKFLSISVQLGLEACKIIRQFSLDKHMKTYEKSKDDHVTQADYKVQSMLIKGFKLHFPQLKIIGEESQQFSGIIDYNYSQLNDNLLNSSLQFSQHEQNINQCCLWIDPIDCTKGFIQKKYEDVTVLIGMSVNSNPALGVIGIPFKKIGEQRVFDPEILIGSVYDKKAYKYRNNTWKQLKKRVPLNDLTVTTSISRSNFTQQKYIEYMGARNILAGGSGRKIALVIRGQADMMAYVGSATCKWDSCAGDAIIKAMGGKFTTPHGKNINYDPNQSIHNNQGIFCSLNEQIHKKSINFMSRIADEL